MSAPSEEDALLPLSAIQHFLFCARQCALIHVEQDWAENALTVEGRLLHERADAPASEMRRGVRTVTALPIRSDRLGVYGFADVVEFPEGAPPFPVEYKRGRPKPHRADEAQLCAQAMCLEEMFETAIAAGALFYGETRRRQDVAFDDELRAITRQASEDAARLIREGVTPPAVYQKSRCGRCSLIELCRPKAMQGGQRASRWIDRALGEP